MERQKLRLLVYSCWGCFTKAGLLPPSGMARLRVTSSRRLENWGSWIPTGAPCSAFPINKSSGFQPQQRGNECFFGVREIPGFPALAWKSDCEPLQEMPVSHTWGRSVVSIWMWLSPASPRVRVSQHTCRKAVLACPAAHRGTDSFVTHCLHKGAEICCRRSLLPGPCHLLCSQLPAALTCAHCAGKTSLGSSSNNDTALSLF